MIEGIRYEGDCGSVKAEVAGMGMTRVMAQRTDLLITELDEFEVDYRAM